MYVTLRDRPGQDGTGGRRSIAPRVAKTVILLGVVSLLTDISSEMVSAVLPLYLTTQLGLGLVAYGFLDGLYQGVSALVRMTGGYLSDRHHQAKWVATIGYGVSALSRLGLLAVSGFAGITAVITADRLGKGLRTAPRDSLIAAASRPEALGRSFGVHRLLDTIGAALGPLVAFVLLALVPGGYDSIWVVSFGFAVVGVAVIVLFVPRHGAGIGVTRPRAAALMREMTSPRLRRPILAAALLGLLTVGDGFLYLSLQARDDFAALWFPLLYVGTNVAYLTCAVPFGRLADRIGRAKVFIGGHVALLLVYLVAAQPSGGLVWTVVTLMLLGLFYAATDGVLAAMVSPLVAPEARGTGLAAVQTVVVVARFLSSLGFGSLWFLLGPGHALLVVAGLLIAAVPIAATMLRDTAKVVA